MKMNTLYLTSKSFQKLIDEMKSIGFELIDLKPGLGFRKNDIILNIQSI